MSFFSVDRIRYRIQIPLPPKIDPTVTMMQVCSVTVNMLLILCMLECCDLVSDLTVQCFDAVGSATGRACAV